MKFDRVKADFRNWLHSIGTWAKRAYPDSRRYLDWVTKYKTDINDMAYATITDMDREACEQFSKEL